VERVVVHGTLVDVFGVGVLLVGPRGVGKSETSLELIRRGHRLVSDDAVIVEYDEHHEYPIGRPPKNLAGKVEIRLALAELYCPECGRVYSFSAVRMKKGCECGGEVKLRPIQDKIDVDVAELYGVRALRSRKGIGVVIKMIPGPHHPHHDPSMKPDDAVSSTPEEERKVIEWVKERGGKVFHLDVVPGRDLATLIETIALQESLRRRR